MAVEEIKVPQAGESISEGTLNRWLKSDGEYVKVDEPLYELGTDKATQEVAAPVAGTLKILAKEGETVAVGAIVAKIDTSAKAPASVGSRESGIGNRESGDSSQRAGGGIPSPAAARVLAEANLKASDIAGTGPRGRITKGDALAAQASGGRQPPVASLAKVSGGRQPPDEYPAKASGGRQPPDEYPENQGADAPRSPRSSTREPMSQVRRRIAARLLESQNTAATLTTFNEVDMSAVMDLRSRVNDRFEKKHGVKLGFMSIFVKAAVAALKAFPLVNAKIDGNDMIHQNFYDIGVAVSTEKGLMVPILRDADALDFAAIEKKIGELAKKARDGKIAFTDLEGGTFTITNGGIFGSMMSTPILNPPQAAILGMHSIQKRAVVVSDQVVIRPMMYLALSYDHRLIDGREAVQFLVRIKECVENPGMMLVDV